MAGILMGGFILFLIMGIPIAFGMGLAGVWAVFDQGTFSFTIILQRVLSGANSISLLAVPFFILAGHLMNKGGITDRIINFANSMVGRFTGGLGLGNVGSSMLFAGVSGSAVADTTALGSTLIPAMKKNGYDASFSAAVTASSSIVGPIIPPSIPLVIYGITVGSGVSIGALFLGGVIPGFLLGLALMLITWLISKKKNFPKFEPASFLEILKFGGKAIWALLMPIIILVGVLGGIFTVTESAAVAVLYALIIGFFVYKELKIKDLLPIFKQTVLDSAAIMIIIAMANLFAWLMAVSGIPQTIANFLTNVTDNPIVMLLIINLILLFVGCFMEAIAAMIILIPILVPVVQAVGIDLTHFGVIMVFNLMLGLITPPVGLCLFITARYAKISVDKVIKASMPFFLISIGVLLMIILIPDLVLFLPKLFMN